MKTPLFVSLAVICGLLATDVGRAAAPPNPEIVPLGHDTYALTRWANNGFVRHTDKLKKQALEDATAFCAKRHKELKVISVTAKHPFIPLTGFAHAKIVFMALDPNSPQLHMPVAAAPGAEMHPGGETAAAPTQAAPPDATDRLYSDLMKLDDLRKRGILTDKEFEAQKQKLLGESK